MSITYRQAEYRDAATIYHLEQRCFDRPDETFNLRQVRYALSSGRALTRIAEADGHMVGWSVALLRQHRHSVSGRLYAVAVDPAWQGRGIGRQLIEPLIERLAARGASRVYLEVRCDNLGAIALYRKLGFFDHDLLPHYYGADLHGYRMKRELPQAVMS